MKQLDLECLVRAARDKIEYHASVGVGLRFQILVAAQNEVAVLRAIAAIVCDVLRMDDTDIEKLSESELELRTRILLKNLLYQKRIVVEVKVKAWPESAGSHLLLSTSNWDYVLFDTETCEQYLAYLERN